MRNINEIEQLEAYIKHLKSLKRRDGTKIHYAQVRLERLRNGKEEFKPRKRAVSPRKKRPPVPQAKPCPENRAFVLAAEMHDLTRALIALERMR